MHLAFVSPSDPSDVRAYSGTSYFMARALRAHVDRLSVVAPLPVGGGVRGRLAKLRHRLRGEPYLRAHTWLGVTAMAEAAAPEIARLRPDAVLSPSTLPLAALDADVPTAFWADATFEANLDFYPDFTGLPPDNVAEGHAVEKAAIERATVAGFATAHAARSAEGYYGVRDGSVHVVEYGVNLAPEDVPTAEAVAESVRQRGEGEECRLLFVGGGWVRKGGDVALRVAEEMAARGVPTTLTVAGPRPPVEAHPLLRAEGFLRKEVPAERDRLRSLFADSHFLCMPVRAEDFGCVFAEAAAFGLPSLTTNIGGMPTTVGDDAGVLFPFQEQPQAIAERALALLADRAAYARLAASARAKHERVLNWDVACRRMLDLLRPHVR